LTYSITLGAHIHLSKLIGQKKGSFYDGFHRIAKRIGIELHSGKSSTIFMPGSAQSFTTSKLKLKPLSI
jgi:hypothetical protein